jgi:hypothetical protein
LLTGEIGLTCWGSNAGINEENGYLGTGLDWTQVWDGGAQFFDVLVTTPVQATLAGDANCDGEVNFFDIDPFVLALVEGQAAWEAQYDCDYLGAIDINDSGEVDFFDIDPFVTLLVGN